MWSFQKQWEAGLNRLHLSVRYTCICIYVMTIVEEAVVSEGRGDGDTWNTLVWILQKQKNNKVKYLS